MPPLAAALKAWPRRLWLWMLAGGPAASALAYGISLAVALGIQAWPQFRYADWKLYDLSLRLLRQIDHRPGALDVVVVAADEASFKAFDEPIALWHGRIGALVDAMAVAQPKVVGFDVVMPAKSYEAIAPGIDRRLMLPLLQARGRLPLVMGQSVDDQFQPREIFAGFVRLLPPGGIGSVVLCTDDDGVVRRTLPGLCGNGPDLPTLAQRMAAYLGAPARAPGLIDYRVGQAFRVVSMAEVLRWQATGDVQRLQDTFKGRAVLVGLVLPLEDRLRASVALFNEEPENTRVPGVMVHAQILQSLLSEGYIQPLPQPLMLVLTAIACLLWFGRGWRKTLLYWTLFPLLALTGVYGLWLGYSMSQASLLLAAQLAYSARQALESARNTQQRVRVEEAFAGHISPALFDRVRAVGLDEAGQHRLPHTLRVAVLHLDTGLQAAGPASEPSLNTLAPALALLQTAVGAARGLLDSLSGTQATAYFGLPLPAEDPVRHALEAALMWRRSMASSSSATRPLRLGIASGEVEAGFVAVNRARPYLVRGACVAEAQALARFAPNDQQAPWPEVMLSEAAAREVAFHGLQRVAPEIAPAVYRLTLE